MISKPVVVVDLDGTLYDSTARQHLVAAGQWEEYHRASEDDPPNRPVLELLQLLPPHTVVVACTGRNEAHRSITESWLMRHGAPVDHLLMRPDDNYTSDAVVKPQLLAAWAEEHFPGQALQELVWAVLEDRDKMVEMWRDMGLPCWQVNSGSF